jgi:O-antigen/teichoic acid export membrane protein
MKARLRKGTKPRGGGGVRSSEEALAPDRARGTDEEVVFTPDPIDEREFAPPTASPHRVARIPGAKTVKRNTVEVLIFRALSTPLAAALTILQARALGAGGTGQYALAVLTMALFSRLLSELGNATTKEIADRPECLGPVSALALRLCLVFAPLAFVGAVAMTQAPGLFGQDKSVDLELAILAGVALAPNFIRQTTTGILIALGRIRLWNALQVAPNILSLTGFLVFVRLEGRFTIPVVDLDVHIRTGVFDLGVRGAILGWVLAHLVTGTAALVLTREIWWPHIMESVPWETVRGLLTLAFGMGAVNMIIYINYRVEFAFLESFHNDAEMGVYRTAQTVAESLWIITTALATGIWTTVLHEREDRASSTVVRTCLKGILLASGGALVLALLAPYFVPRVFGDEFEASVAPLRWLLPGIVAYGPVAVLSVYVSVRRRQPQYALVGPVLSILVTVGLAFVLVKRHGAEGAAMASSAGYIVCALTFWIMFVRVAGLRWYGRGRPAATAVPAGS